MVTMRAEGLACGRGRHAIVESLELEFTVSGPTAIVGPNGAGKSTVLRALAGLDRPLRGRVLVDDRDLASLSHGDRARTVALVPQDETPPADMTCRELIALGRLRHGVDWHRLERDENVVDAARRAGVDDLLDRSVDRLSGGELRRVLWARALAQEAAVLLLDEPTNHLDLRHQHEVLGALREESATVVAVMHDLDLAQRYFDQIVVIANGGVRACGPAQKVLTDEVLAEVFGVRGARIRHPQTGTSHLVVEPLDAASR